MGLFTVPNSVKAITPLVGQIQIESEAHRSQGEVARLHVFHNRPSPGRSMSRSVSGCCRWTTTGDASWPNFPGRREACPRSWAAAPRPCGRSSANIFSSRSSGRAPNPSRARTRAAWRRWSAPTRTSTNCWRSPRHIPPFAPEWHRRGTVRRDLRLRSIRRRGKMMRIGVAQGRRFVEVADFGSPGKPRRRDRPLIKGNSPQEPGRGYPDQHARYACRGRGGGARSSCCTCRFDTI